MYLTRFQINTRRRGARFLLASQQRVHAAVLSGFPTLQEQDRVLWRVDSGAERTELFVVSPQRPDFTHLVEQAGWPTTSAWETAEYAPFLQRLEEGQQWAFRLTANPVRSVRTDQGGRGVVRAHVTADQQLQWLADRASRCGFALNTPPDGQIGVLLKDRRMATFVRSSAASGRQVSVAMATFEGALEVVDPELLRAALTQGIGRAKVYGCGLLTLARP